MQRQTVDKYINTIPLNLRQSVQDS
jgi:hypothetical protein